MGHLDDALSYFKSATISVDEFLGRIDAKKPYDYRNTNIYKGMVALEAAAKEGVSANVLAVPGKAVATVPIDVNVSTVPAPPPAPTISITHNIPTGTISGTVPWEAFVTGDTDQLSGGTIVNVQFFIDGVLKWTENDSPFRYNGDAVGTLDTTTLSTGVHTFTSRVTTLAGTTAQVQTTADVQNVVTPPPPPPPPASGFWWGFSPPTPYGSNGNPAISSQLSEMKAMGCTFPRVGGGSAFAASDICRSLGFTKWEIWMVGANQLPPASQVIQYLAAYPEAIVEPSNEPNLGAGVSAQALASYHINLYNALVADGRGFQNRLALSSIGNSLSGIGGLTPLQYCAQMAAAGCRVGTGFTYGNYHMYGPSLPNYDTWMHVWTPDASGNSIQKYFGFPKFIITEMGCQIGKDGNTEAMQTNAASDHVRVLKTIPNFYGAQWFNLYDGVTWPGFGFVRPDGTHRPGYNAYITAIA